MSYADLQAQLGLWKPKRKPMEFDRNLRRKHLCVDCAKKNFSVKCELVNSKFERQVYTRYKVDYWRCPRCGRVEKDMFRVEGKGKNGVDSYRMFGGI